MAFSIVPAAVAVSVVGRAVDAIAVAVAMMLFLFPIRQCNPCRQSSQCGKQTDFFLLFRKAVLILFLLLIGCFMSTTECVLLFTPIFLPLMQQVGIDISVFGVVMCLVLMIGQITPPFGTCLFILCKTAGLGMDVVVKETLPLTIPTLITAILCLIFPGLVTFLPGVFS